MTYEDLEALALQMGVRIGVGDVPSALFVPPEAWGPNPPPDLPPVILLPQLADREELTLMLAHEMGHVSLGHRVGKKPRIVLEIEAWHWAKEALRSPALA